MNPYQVLGIKENATPEEIKKAYRKKAKEFHSDKGGNDAKMAELNKAHSILASAQKRLNWDAAGNENPIEELAGEQIKRLALALTKAQADWETQDLVSEMEECVRKKIEMCKKEIELAKAGIKKWGKMIARANRRERRNHIAEAFEQEMAFCNEAIRISEGNVAIQKEMLKQLESYSWAVDKKAPSEMKVFGQSGIHVSTVKIWS